MWRLIVLLGFAAGVAGAQALTAPRGWVLAAPTLVVVWILSHRSARVERAGVRRAFDLVLLLGLAAVLGLGVGSARLEAIDSGAMSGPGFERLRVRGYVTGSAWREGEEVRVPISTPAGRVMVVASGEAPPRSPPIGRLLMAEGTLAPPPPGDELLRGRMRRIGISHELQASEITLTKGMRGGFAGILDQVRVRAERGIASGLSNRQADLARGFVLGGDDRLDPATEEDFRRTGLTHLVAVSGQNVMLLAALAGIAFGLLGLRLRPRLVLTIVLIALYVPITGGGASIQRAAVMGSAGLLATVLGRPSDRAFVLALALAATLVVNPRFTGDAGWQLSFAAVAGIGLWASRIRVLLAERRPFSALPDRIAAPLAEAVGITVAATLATAPLIAFTFERISAVSLLANVAVAPAVAPAMWLGMLASFLAQIDTWPLVPTLLVGIGHVARIPIDYIAGVAHQLAALGWAEAEIDRQPLWALALTYGCLACGAGSVLAIAERRGGLAFDGLRLVLPASAAGLLVVLLLLLGSGDLSSELPDRRGMRMIALDVGQGDATLLQPRSGAAILVDAGPVEADVADLLGDLGVERLGALLITHDQADHAGGAAQVLGRVGVDVMGRPVPMPALDRAVRSRGTRVATLTRGRVLRSGTLTVEVLWPEPGASPPADPNLSSLVLLAEDGGSRALLTGDAEQEMTHLRPGPIDVLKVAHHGSADAGLDAMLAASDPAVATISVGAGNTYGHPAAETVGSLSDAGVCTLRTDEDGTLVIDLGREGPSLWTDDGGRLDQRPGCAGGPSPAARVRSRRPP